MMLSLDSLDEVNPAPFWTDSDLESVLNSGLGDFPRSMELPLFEELNVQRTEGRDDHEVTLSPVGAMSDHDYYDEEGDQPAEELEEVKDEHVDETLEEPTIASSRPRRQVTTKKRYASSSSIGSLEVRENIVKRIKSSGSDAGSQYNDKSMSRNAVAARENRQKKKEYISKLEASYDQVRKEYSSLKKDYGEMSTNCSELQDRVAYLEAIIANSGPLASLIKTVQTAPGFKQVTASIGGNPRSAPESSHNTRKRKINDENAEELVARKSARGAKPPNPGICLHVADGSMSVEFCQHCSARSALRSLPKK